MNTFIKTAIGLLLAATVAGATTLSLNLSDVSLDDHNVSVITFYGDDDAETNVSVDVSAIADGDNNLTATFAVLDINYSLYVETNDSGTVREWWLSFCDSSLYKEEGGSCFAEEITNSSADIDLNLSLAYWELYAGDLDPDFSENGWVATSVEGAPDYTSVSKVLIQSDGKVVVVGITDSQSFIIRYDTEGVLDTTFGDAGKVQVSNSGYFNAVLLDDDSILVGGAYVGSDLGDPELSLYDANGTLDTSFGNDGNVTYDDPGTYGAYVDAMAINDDGSIITASSIYEEVVDVSETSYIQLLKYEENGTLDASFGTDGNTTTFLMNSDGVETYIGGMGIQSDGKMVVGFSTYESGDFDMGVARFDSNGDLDTTFGTDGNATIELDEKQNLFDLVLLDDDSMLLVGHELNSSTGYDVKLFKLDSEGALDTTFGTDGNVTLDLSGNGSDEHAYQAMLQEDGRILVVGYQEVNATDWEMILFRLESNGSLDTSFGLDGIARMETAFDDAMMGTAITMNEDGYIIAAGSEDNSIDVVTVRFANDITQGFINVSDLNLTLQDLVTVQLVGVDDNTTYDIDLSTLADGENNLSVWVFDLDQKYNLYLETNNSGRLNEWWYNFCDGLLYGEDTGSSCFEEEIAAGDAIFGVDASDDTSWQDNTSVETGDLDPDFGDDGTTATEIDATEAEVTKTLIQSDGKILVIGSRSTYKGYIARYDDNGSIDTTFGTDGILNVTNNNFYDAVLLDDDGFLLGGSYHGDNASGDPALIQYDADGNLDATFGTDGNVTFSGLGTYGSSIGAIAVQDDGSILTASSVNEFDGTNDHFYIRLLKYDENGTRDTSFGTDDNVTVILETVYGAEVDVADMTVLDSGKILVAFNRNDDMDEDSDMGVLRLGSDGSLDTTFGTDGNTTVDLHDAQDQMVSQMVVLDDGSILLVGSDDNLSTGLDVMVLKLDVDGAIDTTFGNEGNVTIDVGGDGTDNYGMAVLVQENGSILVGGYHEVTGSDYEMVLLRLDSNGSLDTTFGTDGIAWGETSTYDKSWIEAMAMDDNGYIVAAGFESVYDKLVVARFVNDLPRVELDLSNVTLSEHNITAITLVSDDENVSFDVSSLADGENNLSATANYSDINYSIRIDTNDSGTEYEWWVDLAGLNIYLDDNGSDDFKTTFSGDTTFPLDLAAGYWEDRDPTFDFTLSAQSTNEDTDLSFDLNVTDDDGDTISYSADSNDTGLATVTIDSDGTVTLAPVADQSGLVTVTVTAAANGVSISQEVNVTISAVNDAPDLNTTGLALDGESIYFTEHNVTTSSISADYVFAVDLDGDGDMDILATAYDNDQVAWYENDGSQNFTEHNVSTSAEAANSVYAIDVDSDGDVDILSASGYDDRIAWYENNGSQSFTEHNVSTTADYANSVYAVDVDSDGDVDILSASSYDDKIAWYENNGSESFTEHNVSTTADAAYYVYATDVDSDGDVDILSASADDDRVVWYENDGSESFTEHNISTTADGASSVYAIDMDSDGDVDILSTSYNDDRVAWYENNGSQSFTEHNVSTTADSAFRVHATDLDGDGDVDLLAVASLEDRIAWYENDGSESFTEHNITTTASFAYSVYAADVDGDGYTDVLSAAWTDQQIAWYEIQTTLYTVNHTENGTDVIDLNATDVEGDTISWDVNGTDAGLFSISSDGELAFLTAPDYETPSDADADNVYELNITVSDGNDSTILALAVEVISEDEDPTFDFILSAQSTSEDTNVSFDLNVTDPDGDSISYSADSNDSSLATAVITSEGTVTLAPVADMSGLVTVTVTATASGVSITQEVNVTISAINDAPTVTNLADMNLSQDFGTTDFTIFIGDVEGDDLNVTVESNDTSILTVDGNWTNTLTYSDYQSGELNATLTSVSGASGLVTITVVATDGEENTSASFQVTVETASTSQIDGTIYLEEEANISSITMVLFEVNATDLSYTASTTASAEDDTNTSFTYAFTGVDAGDYWVALYDSNETFESLGIYGTDYNGQKILFAGYDVEDDGNRTLYYDKATDDDGNYTNTFDVNGTSGATLNMAPYTASDVNLTFSLTDANDLLNGLYFTGFIQEDNDSETIATFHYETLSGAPTTLDSDYPDANKTMYVMAYTKTDLGDTIEKRQLILYTEEEATGHITATITGEIVEVNLTIADVAEIDTIAYYINDGEGNSTWTGGLVYEEDTGTAVTERNATMVLFMESNATLVVTYQDGNKSWYNGEKWTTGYATFSLTGDLDVGEITSYDDLLPDLNISLSSYVFDLSIGESETLEINLTNEGAGELTLYSMGLYSYSGTTDDYNLTSDCNNTIESGAHCTLTLEYAPTTTQGNIAYLIIVSDDPDTGYSYVTLTANVKTVSGYVLLPDSDTADDNITVEITAQSNALTYTDTVTIEAGDNSAEYNLSIYETTFGGTDLLLGYRIAGGKEEKHLFHAYYVDGDQATTKKSSADTIDVNGSLTDINITLALGDTWISGTLSLPVGETGLDGDYGVEVGILGDDGEIYAGHEYDFNSTDISIDYNISGIYDEMTGAKLVYRFGGGVYPDGYYRSATYNGSGTSDPFSHQLLTFAGEEQNLTGIDFPLALSDGSYDVTLSPGWNLLSLPAAGEVNASGIDRMLDDDDLAYLMRYNPLSGWSYYWLDESYYDAITDRFTSLSGSDGFYVYNSGGNDVTVQLAVKDESFIDTVPDVYAGWNLVGYPEDVTPSALISAIESKSGLSVVILWVYRSGSWTVYLPGASSSLVSPTPWISTIDAAEGIWILVE